MPEYKEQWFTNFRAKFNKYVLSWPGTYLELCDMSQKKFAEESGCSYRSINARGGICQMLQDWQYRAERKMQEDYQTKVYDYEYNRRLNALNRYLGKDPDILLFIYKYKSLDFSESVMKIFEPLIDPKRKQEWQINMFYFIWKWVDSYLRENDTSVDRISDEEKIMLVRFVRIYLGSEKFRTKMDEYGDPSLGCDICEYGLGAIPRKRKEN